MQSLVLKDIATASKLPEEELLQLLETRTETGLSSVEAGIRIARFGPNIITSSKRLGEWMEFLGHFKSPLVIILLVATAISFSVGEVISAGIIFLIIMVSVLIDFFQERDARNAAEELKAQVRNRVVILRDGKQVELPPEELCVGDILLLNAGKVVPADARVLSAKDFFVNQSSLTGESFPCEKAGEPLPSASTDLSALTNIIFMGSNVITGSACAVIIRTGRETEFGKIAEKLVAREEETDFAKGIRQFGYLVMRITIGLVLFIFLVNTILKHEFLESFMFAIAIAVGLTPELLPMVMAVTMSKGSVRMAKKGVIVKKLSAIPNFGSMEVLCTDKTGTLTEDKISLVKCVDINGNDSSLVHLYAYLNSYFQTGIKNPLDDAILDYKQPSISQWQKVDEIPFDFNRRRMSVVVQDQDHSLLICKGAPEEIFVAAHHDQEFISTAKQQYELLSGNGFRVLAIGTKAVSASATFSRNNECDLHVEGFVAFLDPPKPGSAEVIEELKKIGVEVKIITGDNQLVTENVCKQINLPIKGILHGYEMDSLPDEALRERVRSTTVFTRFSPAQKTRVIQALKSQHRAVGYMGDGINDAPSLKTADIGISVNNATDVAKDAAHIILTQKDLSVLREGIIEGRKTFGNTMKYILMGLSSNFGNMLSVAAATIFLPFLPMLPVQILVNNFLYDTSQLAIPSDNVDESYIVRPQRWNMKMIRTYMVIFGITSSVFDIATFYLLYKYFEVNEAQFRTGWFLESLTTQVLVVFIIRTHKLPFMQSMPSRNLVISAISCLIIGWLLVFLPVGKLIGFQILPWHIIIFVLALVFIYLIVAELVKRMLFYFQEKPKQPLIPDGHQ